MQRGTTTSDPVHCAGSTGKNLTRTNPTSPLSSDSGNPTAFWSLLRCISDLVVFPPGPLPCLHHLSPARHSWSPVWSTIREISHRIHKSTPSPNRKNLYFDVTTFIAGSGWLCHRGLNLNPVSSRTKEQTELLLSSPQFFFKRRIWEFLTFCVVSFISPFKRMSNPRFVEVLWDWSSYCWGR